MRKIRVVVIDDSAYNRRTITRMLQEISNVEVVGYATNGEEGLKRVIELRPDIITLDLEMPKMDGFTMLRLMMHSCPTPAIVISAKSEDERVFKALELGAADFIAKPSSNISEELLKIKEDLLAKVLNVFNLNMAGLKRQELFKPPEQTLKKGFDIDMTVRPIPRSKFDLVAIGSSTGGPPALQRIFDTLPEHLPFGIVVSQHMPVGFTRAFADRLNRTLPFEVKEAQDGDELCKNRVLIAPGGKNFEFKQLSTSVIVRLVQPPSEDKFIPSVDAMFSSLAPIYGTKLLAVVLTGMGNDGSKGVKKVKASGGVVLAESEESSVVFGMPREAIATGVVSGVYPIERMGHEIAMHCGII